MEMKSPTQIINTGLVSNYQNHKLRKLNWSTIKYYY